MHIHKYFTHILTYLISLTLLCVRHDQITNEETKEKRGNVLTPRVLQLMDGIQRFLKPKNEGHTCFFSYYVTHIQFISNFQ